MEEQGQGAWVSPGSTLWALSLSSWASLSASCTSWCPWDLRRQQHPGGAGLHPTSVPSLHLLRWVSGVRGSPQAVCSWRLCLGLYLAVPRFL